MNNQDKRWQIVEMIKNVEHSLRGIGGEGKGIKELLDSLGDNIDPQIVKRIKTCNHIRNQIVHGNSQLSEAQLYSFTQNYQEVCSYFGIQENNQTVTPQAEFSPETIIDTLLSREAKIGIGAAVCVGALAMYLFDD